MNRQLFRLVVTLFTGLCGSTAVGPVNISGNGCKFFSMAEDEGFRSPPFNFAGGGLGIFGGCKVDSVGDWISLGISPCSPSE